MTESLPDMLDGDLADPRSDDPYHILSRSYIAKSVSSFGSSIPIVDGSTGGLPLSRECLSFHKYLSDASCEVATMFN